MRIRTLALATTLSLLGTTSLISAAQAQKGLTLQPQTAWAIKRVNEGSSNAYCAVARRFKQNLILTVAKNATRETSIALDFGKQSFTPGQTYKITLDPGAGAQRQFDVTPASDKAFVIRVGHDPKFTSSLAKTGYLRVELNNELYNFNLADIDEGDSHLDACLVSMVKPAAGDDGTESALSVASSSNVAVKALKNEKRKLESRLATLEQENASLKQSLKPTEISPMPVINPDSALVASLKGQVETLKAQNEKLKQLSSSVQSGGSEDVSIVALARENQKLKEMLSNSETSSEAEKQLQMLGNRVSSLEQENLDLTRKLTNASASNEDSQALTNQLMALKSENKSLRQSLDNDNIAQENFQELRENIKNLELSNDSLNQRVKTLAEEKARVVGQLNYYEEENDTLKDKISAKGSDMDILAQLRKEIRSIESGNAQLLSDKEMEIAALNAELEGLKTEKARMLSSNDSDMRDVVKRFEAQTEVLRIKNEALKDELINLSKDQASIDLLNDKISTLENEKQELAISLQNSENAMNKLGEKIANLSRDSAANATLEIEITSLNEKIMLLEARNSDLLGRLEHVQGSLSEDTAQISSLEMDIAKLAEENKKLRSEILTSASSEEGMNQKISLLQNEKEELQRQISHRNSKTEEQIATLEKERQLLQERLEKLSENQNDKVASLLADRAKLEKQLEQKNAAAVEEIASLEQKIVEQQDIESKRASELAAIIQENQALEEKLRNSDDDKLLKISSLQNSLETLQKQNDKLKNNFKSKEVEYLSSIEGLKSENDRLQNAVERVEMQKALAVESLNKEIEQSKSKTSEALSVSEQQAAATAQENVVLLDENKKLNSENRDLKLALDTASAFNENLQKDWQDALARLESLKIENAKYESMVMGKSDDERSGSQELDALRAANAELSTKLKDQQKEFLVLVQEYETLKTSRASGDVSAEALQVKEDKIQSLTADNKALKSKVANLDTLINQKESAEYREVSMQQKTVLEKAPLKKHVAEKVEVVFSEDDKGAGYSSQHEQAHENIQRMKSKAFNALEQEREEISRLVEVEPAAGSDEESVLSFEDTNGLTEAQKMERRMKGQISSAPTVSPAPKVRSETLAKLDAMQSIEAENIEPPRTMGNAHDIALSNSAKINDAASDASASSSFASSIGIESILQRAGIQLSSNVEKVAKFSSSQNSAYQWKSGGGLYGSAQQKPISNDGQFDEYVRDYLTSTENRCSGDFAIMPSATGDQMQVRVDSYEIACVGAGVDSSASVVFFSQDGVFTVLAHEAPTESMSMAMEARDKIATTIGRS